MGMKELKAWAVELRNIKSGMKRIGLINLDHDTIERLCHDYYDGVIDDNVEAYEIIPCKVVFESERKC